MADDRRTNAAELASAYLDDEVSDERAPRRGDPALLAEVERCADRQRSPRSRRRQATYQRARWAPALAAFDEFHGTPGAGRADEDVTVARTPRRGGSGCRR